MSLAHPRAPGLLASQQLSSPSFLSNLECLPLPLSYKPGLVISVHAVIMDGKIALKSKYHLHIFFQILLLIESPRYTLIAWQLWVSLSPSLVYLRKMDHEESFYFHFHLLFLVSSESG